MVCDENGGTEDGGEVGGHQKSAGEATKST